MLNKIKGFAKSSSGAVTVDWVVLTAAVVALSAGIAAVVLDSEAGGIGHTLKEKITNTVNGLGEEGEV